MTVVVIKAKRGFGGKRNFQALGRLKSGEMNKTEAAYSWELERRKLAGEILRWGFEQVKLKLADKTWYTPDFWVLFADGRYELHEVKGFWQDDARVKVKVAASLFPWPIVIVQKQRGSFVETERFEPSRPNRSIPEI